MKRSFLMSALVLALAATMPACAGGAGGGEAKDGSTDGEKKDGESSGDAVADLKASIDGIQKDIDSLFDPIRNADAVIDSVAKLPADLKAMKSKVDPKKLMAELKKVLDGADPVTEGLKLEDEVKAKVQERIDKVKALVASIKDLPAKVAELPKKFEELPKKLAAALPVAAKAAAKAKAPFGVSAEDKKKAEETIKMIEDYKTSIPAKIDEWKKLVTDIPAKAKDLPAKLQKAFS